jgi:pimeloyl-ACP methyl ester carboxylesterase
VILPRSSLGILLTTLVCWSARDSPSAARPLASQEPVAWHDPSPHNVRRIAVARGVVLEALDWGGTGEPLVFLSGLGNTGHVFDDFAPQFTDKFHVVAFTRRGFGSSTQPASGYDVETRVTDLLAVLDSLHLPRVNLVGHSIAGDELTGFAARHPGRVRRLVYLDAASDHRVTISGSRPPLPTITAADSASPAAIQALSARLGQPVPEAEVRATLVFGSNGRPDRDVTPASVFGAIMKGLEEPPYSRVRAPALAFYARYESPEAVLSPTWWASLDSAGRRQALATLQLMAARSRNEEERFRAGMSSGTVIELAAANHLVWVTNREQVASAMRQFLEAR